MNERVNLIWIKLYLNCNISAIPVAIIKLNKYLKMKQLNLGNKFTNTYNGITDKNK